MNEPASSQEQSERRAGKPRDAGKPTCPEPRADIAAMIAEARALLATEPSLAEDIARELLLIAPDDPDASLLLASGASEEVDGLCANATWDRAIAAGINK